MAEQHKYYKGKIKYHRTDDLRQGSLPYGSVVHLKALWIAADDERFAGDMIFQPAEEHHWLPERDLEILSEITYDEYYRELIHVDK